MAYTMLEKIVSGGQTGVDRGALDAALGAAFPCGGWCPPGRQAEDGVIPQRYPLDCIERGGYRQRTRRNVIDSDGTLIVHHKRLSGGTRLTLEFCVEQHKPFELIDAAEVPVKRAIDRLQNFINSHAIRVLNVAGPRASGWPAAAAYSSGLIRRLLTTD